MKIIKFGIPVVMFLLAMFVLRIIQVISSISKINRMEKENPNITIDKFAIEKILKEFDKVTTNLLHSSILIMWINVLIYILSEIYLFNLLKGHLFTFILITIVASITRIGAPIAAGILCVVMTGNVMGIFFTIVYIILVIITVFVLAFLKKVSERKNSNQQEL